MNTEKILSFIVPVYNTEKYISRCLDSLLEQSIPKKDYDIIVVNDGSTDNSGHIIEDYGKKYDNIILITQKNAGQSAARNAGIQRANSKYVWFIDSDDWIAENCLGLLMEIIQKNHLDAFCVAPSKPFNSNFEKDFNPEKHLGKIQTGIAVLKLENYPIGVWCYIFEKKLILDNDITFLNGIYFEDEDFMLKLLFFAQSVLFINDMSVYSYFIRSDSTCRTISEKHVFDKLSVSISLSDFLKSTVKDEDKRLEEVFQKKIYHMLLLGINEMVAYDFDKNVFNRYIEKAMRVGLIPLKYRGRNIKEILIIKTLGLSSGFYRMVRRFLKRSW